MSDYQTRLNNIGQLLIELLPLISQADAKVIRNDRDIFNHIWIEKVMSMSDEMLCRFDGGREFSLLQDEKWHNLIQEIKSLTFISKYQSEKNSSLDIPIPGKKKKRYELTQIHNLLQNDKGKKLADFGGGVGNTSAFLRDSLKLKPLVIEADKDLISSGKEKFSNSLNYLNLKVDGESKINALKGIDLAFGLHTCGNFANNMLDLSMRANVPKIINFGCCYSKIQNDNYNLSRLAEKTLKLNQRALSIGTLSFTAIDPEIYKFRIRIMDYKYSFYHFMQSEYGEFQFLPMSNARRNIYKQSIDDFFYQCFDKFFPEKMKPDRSEIIKFYDSDVNRNLLKYFKAYYAIGRYIGELVESYLLFDRTCWCEERGYRAEILKVFDPQISPRNKAIILHQL